MHQLRPRQTYEEFVCELEQEKARERKAMASWRVQMREQRKPMPTGKQFAAVFVGCLVGAFLVWQAIKWVIDAVLP